MRPGLSTNAGLKKVQFAIGLLKVWPARRRVLGVPAGNANLTARPTSLDVGIHGQFSKLRLFDVHCISSHHTYANRASQCAHFAERCVGFGVRPVVNEQLVITRTRIVPKIKAQLPVLRYRFQVIRLS